MERKREAIDPLPPTEDPAAADAAARTSNPSEDPAFLGGIQGRFFLLLISVFLIIGLIQSVVYYRRYQADMEREFRVNLEMARSVGNQFKEFVNDILRQELAIGLAVAIHGSAKDMLPLFRRSKAEYEADVHFNWVLPDGRVAHAGDPAHQGSDLGETPFFRRIRNGAPFDLSDLWIDDTLGETVFSIARRVDGPDGNLLGAVVAVVRPASLDGMFDFRAREERALGVIDRNARAVSRYPSVAWTWEMRNLSRRYPVIADALGGGEVTAVLPSVDRETARMVAFSPVGAFGWAAAASLPVESMEGPILGEIFSQAALFAVLASLALAAALYIFARITEPIQQLRRRALDLARGETDGAVEVRGPAEVRALASTFNTMARKIDLREKLIERQRSKAQDLAAEMATLAEERQRLLRRMNALVKTSAAVLSETTRKGILQRVVDGARTITGSRLGTAGHGFDGGVFQVAAASRSEDAPPCPPVENFKVHRGGVYLDLVERRDSLRLSREALEAHPAWWGLPEDHVPLNGLLGARLTGEEGRTTGLILVSDPGHGGFTGEDEMLLRELASLASLGLRHIESREGVERQVAERTRELREVNERLRAEIQDRRLAEQALEYQREILERIIENIPVMLCFYAPDGQVELINREFKRLLGWSLKEVKQIDIMEVCYPDPEVRREAWEFMMAASRQWRDFEIINRRGDAIDSSWANVRLSDGTRIGIGIDISWRTRAEAALREYAAKLEWSNQELQDFAFVASHDLQEPLRKVQAFGNLLEEEYAAALGGEGRDYVDRMRRAAGRMAALIEGLLSYSRVTTKGAPFTPVDLAGIVAEAVSDLELVIGECGARVEVGELPTIEADPSQMAQLFLNLIGNAVKFRGKGVPEIRIYDPSGGRPPEVPAVEDGWRRVCVADNGIGIAERHLERIFIPFQRLHGRAEYEGTGMGLAICRKIVNRHQGEITVESRMGEGTTFTVLLPAKRPAPLAPPGNNDRGVP